MEIKELIKFHKLNPFTNVEIRENADATGYYLAFIWGDIDKILIKQVRNEEKRGAGKAMVKYFKELDTALKSINKVGYKGNITIIRTKSKGKLF